MGRATDVSEGSKTPILNSGWAFAQSEEQPKAGSFQMSSDRKSARAGFRTRERMKDFFLADAAKHRGRNIRSHFLVAQKQLRDRNDGNCEVSFPDVVRPHWTHGWPLVGQRRDAGLQSSNKMTL